MESRSQNSILEHYSWQALDGALQLFKNNLCVIKDAYIYIYIYIHTHIIYIYIPQRQHLLYPFEVGYGARRGPFWPTEWEGLAVGASLRRPPSPWSFPPPLWHWVPYVTELSTIYVPFLVDGCDFFFFLFFSFSLWLAHGGITPAHDHIAVHFDWYMIDTWPVFFQDPPLEVIKCSTLWSPSRLLKEIFPVNSSIFRNSIVIFFFGNLDTYSDELVHSLTSSRLESRFHTWKSIWRSSPSWSRLIIIPHDMVWTSSSSPPPPPPPPLPPPPPPLLFLQHYHHLHLLPCLWLLPWVLLFRAKQRAAVKLPVDT